MNKKGIELSVNFLVTIIIALVIFGFGVKFVYNLASGASEMESLTTDDLDERIGDLLCESADKVCIGVNRKVIPRGEFDVFGIKVINVVEKIDFKVDDFEESSIIELSTENLKYEILVYVFSKEEKEKQTNFRFEPSELNISTVINSNKTRIIYLRNIGETEIENISLKISDSLLPYVSLSIDKIGELNENFSKKIELYIFSDAEEKSIEGQITAKTSDDELYAYTSVFLNFLKDYIHLDEEDSIDSKNCSELNGVICVENQKCEGNINYTTDGVCCLGTCQEEKESSTGKIIGWFLLFIIIIFIAWFYLKKYKKVESVNDLMKILKK